MAKLDISKIERRTGSIYPAPFDQEVAGRSSLRLGDAGGLTQFGVNIVYLEPGAKSSMRHWHKNEDEFVMVTQGTLMLHMDDGETEMNPGDCAAFPAGDPNGHCMINRSDTVGAFLVAGTKAPSEEAIYPDHNLKVAMENGVATFRNADGTLYVPNTGEEK